MSARLLTAYLVSVGLTASIISQALAKPPDLPTKVQINCEKCSDKLVLKTYAVADLVVPIENAPWPDLAGPAPTPAESKRAPEPVLASPPAEVIPQPFGFVTMPVPPPAPYFPVPIPLVRAPVFGDAKPTPEINRFTSGFKFLNSSEYQVPTRANDPYYLVSPPATKSCCPACASANCTGYGADSPCQAPACVAGGCASVQVPAPQKTLEDRLIRLIVSTVKPESWDVNGGRGTIDYFPLGMALTVNQTPEIQEQVAHLLAALRHLQDEQIAVEVRLISVPKGFGEKVACKIATCGGHCETSCADVAINARETASGSVVLGTGVNSDSSLTGSDCVKKSSPCPGCCSHHPDPKNTAKLTFLSDAQIKKLMEDLQANPKTNVMMAPKLSVFNGQPANVQVNDQQFFVTNTKFILQGDQPVFIPENHPFSTGFRFSVKPTISPDRRFIQMALEIEETNLDTAQDHVPLFPVTTFITPRTEDGAKCDPVPFTMFLQQPSLLTQRVHQEVCVPCGQTALFKTWTRCTEVRDESEFPILSSLPYIGDMFKNVSYHHETADVWVMVTPRILVNQREEIRSPAAAAAPTVTDNLQKLQQARVLLEQADHCCRMGQAESAGRIYEKVRELCPGSRYAQMAARRMKLLQAAPYAEAPVDYSEPQGGFCYLGQYLASKNLPTCRTDPKVDALLEKYHKACAQGRLSEATQWAVQALALDPACFSKARDAGWKKSPQPAVMPSAN